MANIGTDASDFFQSDASLRAHRRRDLKQGNTLGDPRPLPAKILHLAPIASPLLDAAHAPYLLATDAGHAARVVAASTGKTVAVLRGHTGPVTAAVWYHDAAADDTFVFTGSWDKTVRKWSLKTREPVATYALHADFVKSLALTPDRRLLLSGSSDRTIRVLDLAAGTSTVLKGHARGVEALLVTSDSRHVFSGGSEGAIRKWDLATGACVATLDEATHGGHATSVYALAWGDADGADETLWSASADKHAICWNLAGGAGKERAECRLEHADYVKCLLPLGGSVLVTGSRDESIRVWDVASETLIKAMDGHYDQVSALCLAGNTLYSGSLDGTIRAWKLSDVLDPKVEFRLNVSLEEGSATQEHGAGLTAEEEAELAELLSDDDA